MRIELALANPPGRRAGLIIILCQICNFKSNDKSEGFITSIDQSANDFLLAKFLPMLVGRHALVPNHILI